MHCQGRLPEPVALVAFTAVCEAVAIMHAQLPPIAHRRALHSSAMLQLRLRGIVTDARQLTWRDSTAHSHTSPRRRSHEHTPTV